MGWHSYSLVLFCAFFALAAGQSCVGKCNVGYDSSLACQCNDECENYGNCCDDYVDCKSSCQNRVCSEYDTFYACQCNDQCTSFGNCCDDASSYCSCAGRSCTGHSDAETCQCNSVCENYGDCCPDVDEFCGTGGGDTGTGGSTGCSKQSVSNAELLTASFDMWNLDYKKAQPSDYTLNPQSTTSSSSTTDVCPQPFFTWVNPSVLQQNNFVLLQNLQDNYIYTQGYDEDVTSEELTEQSDFLDYFLDTEIGKYLYQFLTEKNQIDCGDENHFKTILSEIWFGLYSRQNNALDTSGFEHAFVGEIKSGSVSGFHSWVQFYNDELTGVADYYGYTTTTEPDLYGIHLEWHGYMKGLAGMAIGTSPEIEFALFTLCHLTKPDSVCGVQLTDEFGNPVNRNIQTWTWSKTYPSTGYPYVASSYFLV